MTRPARASCHPRPAKDQPKTSHERLLAATWNNQSLGNSTRYEESFSYIAEVLSRFDVIAVQEVKRDLGELDKLCTLLGPWWRYLVSDVTEGHRGNQERLVYVFDIRKVRHSGLADELVLPAQADADGEMRAPRQIARTPFAVGRKAARFNSIIATVHISWGEEQPDHPLRVEEVRQIAKFLDQGRGQTRTLSRNLILLGHFTIFNPRSEAVAAFESVGFHIPHEREHLRASNAGKDARYYDQIAFAFDDAVPAPHQMGVVDVFEAVYTDEKFAEYAPTLRTASGRIPANVGSYYRHHWRRRQMADHAVLWAELSVDFSGEYLRGQPV
ncbi:MAG: endonuclease/exonuclease/phosphatase family metal-dependent hydrolase [Gammaproteobacteria bacterium]|jgi:endonuclease/exonuclease/phosphatase family metal-dependent hydrolase